MHGHKRRCERRRILRHQRVRTKRRNIAHRRYTFLTKGIVGTELAGRAEIATAAELGAYGETDKGAKHFYKARLDAQSRCRHERANEKPTAWAED